MIIMNILLVGIVLVVMIVLGGVIMRYVNNMVWVMALYILGFVSLVLGVYLLPATMWRGIAIACLVVGVLLELVAIVLTIKAWRTPK